MAQTRLDDAGDSRMELPLLDSVRIASPCSADWEEMTGDERVRHCSLCQKNVYNLAAMTKVEAEQFLQSRTSKTCVRLFRRTDGTILTADCPVGLAKVRARLERLAVASLAIAATLFMGAASAVGMMRSNASGGPGSSSGKNLFSLWKSEVPVSQPDMGEIALGQVALPNPVPLPVPPPIPTTTPLPEATEK